VKEDESNVMVVDMSVVTTTVEVQQRGEVEDEEENEEK